MFEKSGFPRIDEIFEAAEGLQFVPSGYLHFKSALQKAGPQLVTGWAESDLAPEIWNAADPAAAAAKKRWSTLVDWFRKKLFEGKLSAHYLSRDGNFRHLEKSTFALKHAEYMFREHQHNFFPLLLVQAELDAALKLGALHQPVIHTSPKPKLEIANLAISTLWPNGVPSTITAKKRDNQISEWCKTNGKEKPSPRVVRKALQTRKSAILGIASFSQS